jgi:hypothetical protein
MAKDMGPFRDSQAPSLICGPRTDVSAEPPLIGPAYSHVNRIRKGTQCI